MALSVSKNREKDQIRMTERERNSGLPGGDPLLNDSESLRPEPSNPGSSEPTGEKTVRRERGTADILARSGLASVLGELDC
jgi:hypothetical protein